MNEWVALIERVGFPIFASLLVFYWVIRAIRWYASVVLEPKAKADVALLDSVRETNNKHAESQAKLVEAQLMQSELLSNMVESQKTLAEGQRVQTELLREISLKHREN